MNFKKFWNGENKKSHNDFNGQSNGNKGILYCLVAIYIGYMGYSILSNRLRGDDTLSYPLAILFTLVLVIGALWIFWYGVRVRKNSSGENPLKEEIKDNKVNDINETKEINENNEANEVMEEDQV
jgi:threonine/homoserine/homoserine lactone efflux protein